jgi:hypothetical protein
MLAARKRAGYTKTRIKGPMGISARQRHHRFGFEV